MVSFERGAGDVLRAQVDQIRTEQLADVEPLLPLRSAVVVLLEELE